MSLKVTMIAVAAAGVLGFSGGFFVESKIAAERMLTFQKQVSDAAEAQRKKFEARRLDDERAVAEAISQRDKAIEDLEASRADFGDELARLRVAAVGVVKSARTSTGDSPAGSCERRLSELRSMAKKSAALHHRCAKILAGITADYGKAAADQRAAADIVKKLTNKK